jgi:hypothetical protein
MDTPQEDENIISGMYEGYQQTKREILDIEIRKTRNKLLTIAIVLLAFNFLAVYISKIPISTVLFDVLLLPVIFFALTFLSLKEPLVAMVTGMIVMFGFWIYVAVALDVSFLLKGWLGKALIIYLLFAGLQNAREAHSIKKELKAS